MDSLKKYFKPVSCGIAGGVIAVSAIFHSNEEDPHIHLDNYPIITTNIETYISGTSGTMATSTTLPGHLLG